MDNINPYFYDLIINIESFDDLKSKGWKIDTTEPGIDKYEYYKATNEDKDIEKKKLNRIGVLGVSNVGKTFILKQLINKKDEDIPKTKGISIIYPEKNTDNLFVCIDSQGSEEPIIDQKKEKEEIYKLNGTQRKDLVKKLSKDKKCIEIFIQDFIIEKSNILIVVVDQLTFSEQKLINRLKQKQNFLINYLSFIIHNFLKVKKLLKNILKML